MKSCARTIYSILSNGKKVILLRLSEKGEWKMKTLAVKRKPQSATQSLAVICNPLRDFV